MLLIFDVVIVHPLLIFNIKLNHEALTYCRINIYHLYLWYCLYEYIIKLVCCTVDMVDW